MTFAAHTQVGHTVFIQHPNRWTTYYTHLSSLAAAKGRQHDARRVGQASQRDLSAYRPVGDRGEPYADIATVPHGRANATASSNASRRNQPETLRGHWSKMLHPG